VHRMVWSTISKDDLQEAEADPDETEGIIDDLLTNAPGAEVIFLIKQSPDLVSVSMRSTNNQADVGKFCAENGGGGHVRAAGFKLRDGRPFDEIVSDVISKVRRFQAERLNIHPMEEPIDKPIGEPIEKGQQKPNPQSGPPSGATANNRPTIGQQSEKKSGQVTYLDFKKPKPIGEPMGGPIETKQKPKPQSAQQSGATVHNRSTTGPQPEPPPIEPV